MGVEMNRPWRRLARLAMCLSLACASLTSTAATGFQARLKALDRALETAAAGAVEARPAERRKILWLNLAGDSYPDALVVQRWHLDDCFSPRHDDKPCLARLFAGRADGGFDLITEFRLRHQPALLRLAPGGVRDLYFASSTDAQAAYARYRLEGGQFARIEEGYSRQQMQSLPMLVVDDRLMPAWSDQAYAASQFPNQGARLAPFRLVVDALVPQNRRLMLAKLASGELPQFRSEEEIQRYLGANTAEYERRSAELVEALMPDGQALAAALAWPQTLELRLWVCNDWMVERRFWEVESRRPGRLGACVEPALLSSIWKLAPASGAADLARVALLHQVGVAYLLRVAPLSLADREGLRSEDAVERTRFHGAVAGQWMGHQLRLLSLDRSASALAALRAVAFRWFEHIEQGERDYVDPSPELAEFNWAVERAAEAHQCVRRLLGLPAAKALSKLKCSDADFEAARTLATQMKQDLKP